MTHDVAPSSTPPRCFTCGEPHEIDQQYCLECGARLVAPPAAQRETPLWAWVVVVVLALVAIISGIVVALLASSDDPELAPQATPVQLTITAPVVASAPVEAPVTVPLQGPDDGIPSPIQGEAIPDLGDPASAPGQPLTGEDLIDDGLEPQAPQIPDPFDPAALPPPPGGTSGIGQWPSGTEGYTVVLASIPESRGLAEAEARGARAQTAGLDEVGVLRSSNFSSLRPGFWVTYAGVYGTLNAARAELAPARAAGFPSAYTRRVAG